MPATKAKAGIYFMSNKEKIVVYRIDGAIPFFQPKCDLIALRSKAPSTIITNLGAIKYWCRTLRRSVITAGQRKGNKTQRRSSVQSSIVYRALLVFQSWNDELFGTKYGDRCRSSNKDQFITVLRLMDSIINRWTFSRNTIRLNLESQNIGRYFHPRLMIYIIAPWLLRTCRLQIVKEH